MRKDIWSQIFLSWGFILIAAGAFILTNSEVFAATTYTETQEVTEWREATIAYRVTGLPANFGVNAFDHISSASAPITLGPAKWQVQSTLSGTPFKETWSVADGDWIDSPFNSEFICAYSLVMSDALGMTGAPIYSGYFTTYQNSSTYKNPVSYHGGQAYPTYNRIEEIWEGRDPDGFNYDINGNLYNMFRNANIYHYYGTKCKMSFAPGGLYGANIVNGYAGYNAEGNAHDISSYPKKWTVNGCIGNDCQ